MKAVLVRSFCLLLALLLLLPLTVSCRKQDDPKGEPETQTANDSTPIGTEPSVQPSETEETPAVESEDIVIIRDGKACFTVVYPESQYQSAATALTEGLEKKTGIKFPCLRFDPEDGTSLIVIGEDYNKRFAGKELLTNGGSAIAEKDGSLYICGYRETAIQAAVQHLLGQLVPKQHIVADENGKTACAVLPRTVLMLHNPDYPIADPLLLSAHLADYRLVVSAEVGAMGLLQGNLIADRLAIYTGFMPEVVTDAATPTEREIVIGSTNRKTAQALADNAWRIVGEGKRVYMEFGSSYAFDGIYNNLDDIFAQKDTVNLSGTTESYAKHADDIRILTYNVWYGVGRTDMITVQDKYDALTDLVRVLSPDFISFQEVGNWSFSLTSRISEDYGVITGVKSRNMSLFYDKNVWRPATDEKGEIIQKIFMETEITANWDCQWVMFEKINDPSVKVIFGGIHFCNRNEDPDHFYRQWRPEQMRQFNAEIKRLESQYPDVPIFYAGDYNTGITQTGNDKYADGWEDIVGGTKLVTSYTQTEDIGRFFGMDIDHICLNPELTEVMRWRKLDYQLILNISDHLPVFADVRLK